MAKRQLRAGFDVALSLSAAKTWLNRNRGPKPGNIFPADASALPLSRGGRFINSMDPAYLRFTEELVAWANEEFPPDVTESGHAGPSGVPGTFHSSLSVTGYGMNPLPVPIIDNAKFVASLGLASSMLTRHRPWCDAVMECLFGYAAPTNLYIRKEGSTSIPFFTTNEGDKKLWALKLLRNVDHYLTLMMSGSDSDQLAALNEYGTLLAFAIHERMQPDSWMKKDGAWVPKPRSAPTEAEARSGDYAGTTMADKRVFTADGTLVPGHAAMRRRDVFGMSGPVNYLMSAVMNCFKTVFMKRFAFTYLTTTDEDKERKLAPYKFVVGSDVKTMDKTVPRWYADYFFDFMRTKLDDRFVTLMEMAYHAPYVAPRPWFDTPDDYDPCFGESPLSARGLAAMTCNVGLPSGVAYNPIFGRAWMTCVYVCALADAGILQSPGQVPGFLAGKHGVVFLNSADDAVFATNDPVDAAKLRELKSTYAVLEPEEPVVYLGSVFSMVGGKLRSYPNPQTYLSNLLAREDSITDPVRWAQGAALRRQLYSRMPVYRDLNAGMEELARKHLGINPNHLAARMATMAPMSDIDAMVRLNPAVIHYKVDPATVHPDTLNDVVASIPHQDWFPNVKHLFRVPIQEIA